MLFKALNAKRRTCASLPALCNHSVGIWSNLHIRSKPRLLPVDSPSNAANNSPVSITQIPLSGLASGKVYMRPVMGASIAVDFRYLFGFVRIMRLVKTLFLLDILAIIVENEIKRAVLGESWDQNLNFLFEFILVYELGLPEIVALVDNRYKLSVLRSLTRATYIAIVWNESVAIFPSLLYTKMSLLLYFFTIFPSHNAPSELGDQTENARISQHCTMRWVKIVLTSDLCPKLQYQLHTMHQLCQSRRCELARTSDDAIWESD